MIVIVVPIKGEKFLMVYNPKRGWEFPGGKIEDNERLEDAVAREAWEEAGLVLDNLKIIEKNADMVVFSAKVVEVKGGEMKWAFFVNLPENLAFGRDEALRFLNKLHIHT